MATLTQISQALNDLLPKLKPLSMPTGMLGHFYSVPDGWLLCNGAAVSRSTYAALFAVIGTKHGSGDGSTTFNLPNLANRFVEGTTSIGSVGTFKSAGLPNITGGINVARGWGGIADTGALYRRGETQAPGGGAANGINLYLNASKLSSVYGSSSSVQPPAVALLPCVKI
ncbi:phage tail protein [Sutterella wadsworthensis]|uniref:phage tail protein n=1 Tax=Sutterella wadsworthensis TaxID=40545 RepID=UPI0009D65BF8|nr:phage tail protein [Sutterella wadsworthensis]